MNLQHDASLVLQQRIDEQAQQIDFSKHDFIDQPGYREFSLLVDTAFDQSQDMVETRKEMDSMYHPGAYDEAAGRLGATPKASARHFREAQYQQKTLVSGLLGNSMDNVCHAVGTVAQAKALQQHYATVQKNTPEKKFTEIVDNNLMLKDASILKQLQVYDTFAPSIGQQKVAQISKAYIANPQEYNKQIRSGVFENRFQVTEFGTDIENLEKFDFGLKNVKTTQRELEQERKLAKEQAEQQKQPDEALLPDMEEMEL